MTGGYAGCGYQLSKILYQHNATVYVAGRNPEKANKAINAIKQEIPNSKGKLDFLQVDLGDLTSIKPAVEAFKSKESQLHVLTNNAGVMLPPAGSKTTQGYELQHGTNVLGPFLLTKLLMPTLLETAKSSPAHSVRVTWAASLAIEGSPQGGVSFDKDNRVKENSKVVAKMYAQSKACNYLLGAEAANRYGKDGLISVSWNPGNLKSELQRHLNFIVAFIIKLFCYNTIFVEECGHQELGEQEGTENISAVL